MTDIIPRYDKDGVPWCSGLSCPKAMSYDGVDEFDGQEFFDGCMLKIYDQPTANIPNRTVCPHAVKRLVSQLADLEKDRAVDMEEDEAVIEQAEYWQRKLRKLIEFMDRNSVPWEVE